jgi:hypothetical protein
MSARSASPELSDAELGWSPPGRRSGQRAGWCLLLLLVLLAFSGALGSGPLANASPSGPDGLRVVHPRVVHRLGPNRIRILVPSAPAPRERLELELIGLPGGEKLAVSPAPLRERAIPGGARFELATRGGGPVEVDLRNEPYALGSRRLRLAVDGGKPVSIHQFVLP